MHENRGGIGAEIIAVHSDDRFVRRTGRSGRGAFHRRTFPPPITGKLESLTIVQPKQIEAAVEKMVALKV